MEIISFIDQATGKKLYCIGPFREKAQASRAAAGLDRSSASAKQPERGAITRKCWAIFDLLAPKKSRLELIAEAERQGINAGTAATQYQRWRKAHPALAIASKGR